jgi:hypothetical protein
MINIQSNSEERLLAAGTMDLLTPNWVALPSQVSPVLPVGRDVP